MFRHTAVPLSQMLDAATALGFALTPPAGLPRGRQPVLTDQLSLPAFLSGWEQALALPVPGHALVAHAVQIAAQRPLSLLTWATTTDRNITEVGRTIVAYWGLVTDWYPVIQGGDPWHVFLSYDLEDTRPAARLALEYELVDAGRNGAQLVGAEHVLVELRHPLSAEASAAYSEVAGVPVRGACRANRVCVRASVANRPLPTSNAALRAHLRGDLDRALAQVHSPPTVAAAVARALNAGLADGDLPDEHLAARHLAMSTRSLQRSLELEGTSFRALRDQVRLEAATHLLGVLTPTEVSARLGYSAPRAFYRAFKRWSGQPPGAWAEARRTDGG